MTRRLHLMPWLFLALCAVVLLALLLATVHMAAADCVIGLPPITCPPDSFYPPRAYIPAIW